MTFADMSLNLMVYMAEYVEIVAFDRARLAFRVLTFTNKITFLFHQSHFLKPWIEKYEHSASSRMIVGPSPDRVGAIFSTS